MNLTTGLAVVFVIGFSIQCVGGIIVADGHLGGLALTVIGSMAMGFALGVYKTARAVRSLASVELPSSRRRMR